LVLPYFRNGRSHNWNFVDRPANMNHFNESMEVKMGFRFIVLGEEACRGG
jgi:hypothetical protein